MVVAENTLNLFDSCYNKKITNELREAKMRKTEKRRHEAEPPKTLSVPEAGAVYFNLQRAAAYAAARRGELPTIRMGHRFRVSVIALEKMLADAKPTQREDAA